MKGITNSETKSNQNIVDLIYPVGAIYESTNSTSPATLFGGTWTQTYNDYDRIFRQAYSLWDGEVTGNGNGTSSVNILGAYGAGLFGIGASPVPTNYHTEYTLSAQVTTGDSGAVGVGLNNIRTGTAGTWSSNTFRNIVHSDFFKESDITFETTYNYTQNGTNLKVYTYDVTGTWAVYGIILNVYAVSDYKIYKWKRTA